MGDEFYLADGGLAPLSNLHDEVATGLGQLTGPGAPIAADVAQSFGTIAFGVNNALDAASQNRLGTLDATSTASDAISELLRATERDYTATDQVAGNQLTAAGQSMQGGSGGGSSSGSGSSSGGGSSSSGGSGSGGGSSSGGEMIGQIGQQVGQVAQTVGQSVAGLAQGLTQIPQQAMQGVQGLIESVSGSDDAAGAEAKSETAPVNPATPTPRDRAQPTE